jgi:hypothetical protein
VVVNEVVDVAREEAVVGEGARVGGGPVGAVVGGVFVVGGELGVLDVSTTTTSLSAPAPTDVAATKALPVKMSAQL